MNPSTKPVLTALLLAVAACAGTDANKSGADITDLTAAEYALPATATVQVTPTVSAVKIGNSVKLATSIVDADGRQMKGVMGTLAHWQSSDTTVATVSVTGVVTGHKSGKATISAVTGHQIASSVVTVGADSTTALPDAPTDTVATTTTASTTASTTAPATTSTTSTSDAPTTATSTAPTSDAPTTSTTTAPLATAPPPVTEPPLATAPSTTSLTSTTISASGPGLSGLALVSDDFTKYASTAALQNNISVNIGGTGNWQTSLYSDGHDAQLAELDPSVLYNGHPTMKYNAPGGSSSIPGLWTYLPHPLSTMWLRAKIRFSPGFTTTGVLTNSSNAYKLLGWGYANSYGSGRVEITNTTQYQLYYSTSLSGTNTLTSTPNQFGMGGNITTEWSDGGWYDYIVEYQTTSSTTSVARLWIAKDGSTPVLRATSTSTSLSGYTMAQVGYVMLGLNFNQVRAASQSEALWYGQWEVVDGVQHPNPFGLAGNY